MKTFSLLILLLGLVSGCETSTVETRKKESAGAYSALAPDQKALVDAGQIKVGMTPEAVRIAWGMPAQVLESENPRGHVTVWVYEGQTVQEYRYWVGRYPVSDFYPRRYARAEVVFQNGVVISWRTLPRPF